MSQTRCDAFLGGRLRIEQPARGYRSGMDAVLLAAAVPARPGQSVLELGCGAGVASLCLGARVAGLVQTGVELQDSYAALARRNAAANGIALEVLTADLSAPPPALRARIYDHVCANPPYFQRDRGSAAPDPVREAAQGEATPLAAWIDAAARRLTPGGWLTLIQRAERLPDLLTALDRRLGSAEILPLSPRAGRTAKLVLLRARKGGRGAFRLHAPLVLHAGERHERDGDSYTPALTAVLRQGAALPWPA
ncbi:tRNA1(Val) (adenine(37)-N6)-methyltransferase [Rhodovulum adriaticum]|uniref:tRNA1(Val) A37 N6-methylase TrmN6 n=1 Tax=Rhodovulum adriaticum TaxID=35804 RepID=A0A4R2NKL9_RHOAD|nr:methyltransferase [Rhodovulum adriaticum]MBK1635469.1 methyltransferase [Rhodovulum adriaticum]TCP22040.1 tRNA1(Val) A37 N6-methylase TrmN6 [Rhodovulum adriaticum]